MDLRQRDKRTTEDEDGHPAGTGWPPDLTLGEKSTSRRYSPSVGSGPSILGVLRAMSPQLSPNRSTPADSLWATALVIHAHLDTERNRLDDTPHGRLVINVIGFMAGLRKRVDKDLQAHVRIQDATVFPNPGEISSSKPIWQRIDDVVAVAADLKGSTRLSLGRHAGTTASLYEAATGSMVRVVERFGPDFVDIQGDGLFALFHGHRRYERAVCAAITLKSFGQQHLEQSIIGHLAADLPVTGLKVGVASGRLMVKKVGVRGTSEPVWVGRAVNYAVKCSHAADRRELIITPRVWSKVGKNEFVAQECGCTPWLFRRWRRWGPTTVETLPEGAANCRRLPSQDPGWCPKHGDETCQAILDGRTKRDGRPEVAA